MPPLELFLRGLGVALLAMLAAILLQTRRRDHTARIGAALCISLGAFMLSSMPGAARLFGVFIYPLTAICATHPVWFWLFCAALFTDGFKLRRSHVLCAFAMALAGVVYQTIVPPAAYAVSPALIRVLGTVFGAASLAFIGLGAFAIRAGGRSDLDERRRRIRGWVGPSVSIYLAIVIAVQAWATWVGQPTPGPLVLLNLAVIDGTAGLALLSFVTVRVVNWLDLARPSAADVSALSHLERSVLARLEQRLVPERIYAREGLSVVALAEILGTQEHVLRHVINRGLGFRNFNDFLHTHRLREASARLRDPAARRTPVLTIALEAGYGSIGPFNRAFKERLGTTPTEYRRASLDEGGHERPEARAAQPVAR
jgi:AraC-like DNA-binding protein